MFWNKQRNYRSQVKTLLLTMGIPDFDSIGISAIYDQIDIGYHNKFTEHETALTFAYSCIPKLAQQDMSSAIVFYEETAKKQDEWLDSGLITQDVVGRFKELTLIHLDFKQNDNIEAISSEVRTKESEVGNKQSVFADDGELEGVRTEWYENGQKKEEINLKNGKIDGLWTGWNEDGQKVKEINYKNRKIDGLWTVWNEDGQKVTERNYKNGEIDGKFTYWNEDGQKVKEMNYKNGEIDGLWTVWNEDGQKVTETNYKNGEANGLRTQWYENGQKMGEINYKNGEVDGKVTYWKEDGDKYVPTKEELDNFKK